MKITERIHIDRPPEDVWAVVSDPTTHTEWRPGLVEFRQDSEGPLAVGSHIRERIRWRGREIELDDYVTALEPARRLGVRGGWKAADFELDFLLEPAQGGTEVSFDWSFLPKTFFMRLVAPLLGRTFRGATKDELAGLKAYVERPAA
ncbi:MAG: SRPBCC family protein [Actinomycetota bacterium]|nr:SRPBCC family protein [Actinomycetota bacterium]